MPLGSAEVKFAPLSVERHTPLSVPVAQCAHTTGGSGSAYWHPRPGLGDG